MTTTVDLIEKSVSTSTRSVTTRIGNAKEDATGNQARMQINILSNVGAAINLTGIETINVTDVTDTGIREMIHGTDTQHNLAEQDRVALTVGLLKYLHLLSDKSQEQMVQTSSHKCRSLVGRCPCLLRRPTGQIVNYVMHCASFGILHLVTGFQACSAVCPDPV